MRTPTRVLTADSTGIMRMYAKFTCSVSCPFFSRPAGMEHLCLFKWLSLRKKIGCTRKGSYKNPRFSEGLSEDSGESKKVSCCGFYSIPGPKRTQDVQVLILDECTSRMSREQADGMIDCIHTHHNDATVLSIAHRLRFVMKLAA